MYRVADASHISQESSVQQARNMDFRDERQQCRTATPVLSGW